MGPGAPDIDKMTFGLAAQTTVIAAIRATGRKTAVLVGLETDVCVQQSALGLAELGYFVVAVIDAVASPGADHQIGLDRMQCAGITMASCKSLFTNGLEMWVRRREWRESGISRYPTDSCSERFKACTSIHPCQRHSRVLTTLLLLRSGYGYVPYSSLESVVEQSKERYYAALRQTQGTIRTAKPGWQPWLVYFLGVLTEQKSRLQKKIARERIVLGDLSELSVQIIELCRERGHVTISDIAKATGANRKHHKRSRDGASGSSGAPWCGPWTLARSVLSSGQAKHQGVWVTS